MTALEEAPVELPTYSRGSSGLCSGKLPTMETVAATVAEHNCARCTEFFNPATAFSEADFAPAGVQILRSLGMTTAPAIPAAASRVEPHSARLRDSTPATRA